MGNQYVDVKRGEYATSIRFLAQAWKWDKAKVERYVRKIRDTNDPMIKTRNETHGTIITICNYDKYQSEIERTETPTETGSETPTETVARQQRDKREELKELKEEGIDAQMIPWVEDKSN